MSSYIEPSPSPGRPNPKPQSPRDKLRQEALLNSPSSAPASPSRHTHRIRAGYGHLTQPQSATAGKISAHNPTPSDDMRDHDDADPHDLSFPTKHFPRASMVDNLVLSLDQFSAPSESLRGHGPPSSSIRYRNHHPNTSFSFGGDPNVSTLQEIVADESSRSEVAAGQPSNTVDQEESYREKVYNAQRAMQPDKIAPTRANGKAKTRSDSNSSSIDLSHLPNLAGRLGPAGNRRSQSFDFGSVRPKIMADSVDSASVLANARNAEVNKSPGAGTLANQSVTRRNSGKSAKSAHIKKGRSGTVTAGSMRPRVDSPQPPSAFRNQTFEIADHKNTTISQSDSNSTPRAGFFKRVFGSNKPNVSPSTTSSPARQVQDHTSAAEVRRPTTPPSKLHKQAPTEPPQSRETPQVITKKPSSFFRRRKKSVSTGVPPPLPLTLNSNLDVTQTHTGESSPVSSLRAFMDPYLANDNKNYAKHTRGSSLQSVQHADDIINGVSSDPSHPSSRVKNDKAKGHKKTLSQSQSQSSAMFSSPQSMRKGEVQASPSAITDTTLTQTEPTLLQQSAQRPSILKVQHSYSSVDDDSPQTPRVTQTKIPLSQNKASTGKELQVSPTKHGRPDGLRTEPGIVESNSAENYPSAGSSGRMLRSSGSDASDYKSAPSTPLVADIPDSTIVRSPAVHVSHPSLSQGTSDIDLEKARKIYDNVDDDVDLSNASAWLGEASAERERLRTAYMSLFNWSNQTILSALRNLCSKLALKGETQQVDRILDTFASRWCTCNSNHGFKSADIVHTICYSILLLNTDLHLADIGKKMTRVEFVRNAMDAIKSNMPGLESKQKESPGFLNVRTNSTPAPGTPLRPSMDRSASSLSNTRSNDWLSREESYDENLTNQSGPLVEAPFAGSQTGWELQIESVLKDFYLSIAREPLPLFGSQIGRTANQPSTNNLSAFSTLRRTPSTLSKATSETRSRYTAETRSLGARWASKTRPRPRLGSAQAFGSSRTSIDDQSSAWSPSMSSTWSKASLGKTLTSMSVESFGTEYTGGGYQSSIGFANALSQAIIRDEQMDSHADDGIKAAPLLEDESLELYGAPWAKEGILKHKCHLEGVDKRSKDRNWNDCFAVIEKGWMRLFSFSMTAKSLRNKARNQKAGGVVGGGNWQDNAEEVWKFMLRHTIASSLPPPGYSKQRPFVWALSLPNGAVHLFSVGTPDIVKEFVSTANFWSARLSKEPMTGGISSMEYGWSDSIINRSLISSDSHPTFSAGSPRPSTQLSMRSSIDHGNMRPRLPGDKAHISEWTPPQQSLMASQLLEIDQLKALQAYVKNIEDELQKHNELRGPMLLAFSTRHPNSAKAMTNWEKKSSYLLREIVKFGTYIDALQAAQLTKEKVDKMKEEQAAI